MPADALAARVPPVRLWRTPWPSPRRPRGPTAKEAAPLDSALRHVLVFGNPVAGSGPSRRLVRELEEALRSGGLEVASCWDREELVGRAAGLGPALRCVVVAGGDGTLAEVVNRVPGVALAVLPLGTENLVARHLGVRRRAPAVAAAVAAGRCGTFDLVRTNGRLGVLMASAGVDADMTQRVHASRRGQITRLAWVGPSVRTLGAYRFPPIDVDIPETGERLRGAMALVCNLPEYALGLPVAPRARADDGLLDLCVFERPGRARLLAYAAALLCGRLGRLPHVQRRFVRRVRLSASEPVPLQMDGDPRGWLPADIEVVPDALRLVLPAG